MREGLRLGALSGENSSLETSSARLGSDPEAELGGGLQENIDLSGEAGDGLEGDSGA